MKVLRAVVSGILVWSLVFSGFIILSFIPGIKEDETLQGIIAFIFIIPFAYLGTSFYYRNGTADNALIVGVTMAVTALLLDMAITVPFVEVPDGGSYSGFFTSPVLWILVTEELVVVFLYRKLKVKAALVSRSDY